MNAIGDVRVLAHRILCVGCREGAAARRRDRTTAARGTICEGAGTCQWRGDKKAVALIERIRMKSNAALRNALTPPV